MRTFADQSPVKIMDFLALGNELVERALRLKLNLQFSDVEILGVVKLTEQGGVHQLRDVRRVPSITLLGDLE